MLDGKQALTMVAKELIGQSSIKSDELSRITPDDIDNSMMKKITIRDPDLAVICSTKQCLFGLLPWHVRLTEMIKLPKLGPLVPQDFIYVIDQFSQCQQRYGR